MPVFTVLCSSFHTEDHVKVFCVLEKRLSGDWTVIKLAHFIIVFQFSPWGTILMDSVAVRLLKMKLTGENPKILNFLNVKNKIA